MNDEIRELAQAFDLAWGQFVRLTGEAHDTDESRKRLAARIVTVARAGERNVNAISEAALTYMRALVAARAISSNPIANIPAFPSEAVAGAAFPPDTVNAMATALEMCLDELPLRTPSSTRGRLTAAILKAAADGKIQPEDLKNAGMRALKN